MPPCHVNMSRDVATFAAPLSVFGVERATPHQCFPAGACWDIGLALQRILAIQACSQHRITTNEVPAGWWTNLKAASPAIVKKAKEFCTSGKLKKLAYESLDAATTILDTVGPFLPPPGKPQCWETLRLGCSASCASRLLLHRKHNQRFNELVAELSSLTVDATFALNVEQKGMLKEIIDKLNAGMPSVVQQTHASGGLVHKTLQLTSPLILLIRLHVTVVLAYICHRGCALSARCLPACLPHIQSGYRELIRQPHLKALWSDYFMHEQALMDLLKDKDSKDAFRRAVEVEETIFISIDELCLRFPDDSPLLPTVEALLCEGRGLVLRDKDQEKTAIDEAGQGQKLLEGKLESMEARLAQQTYFHLIHQQDLQALWSTHFKHEQAVRWGLWWAVFPSELPLNSTFDAATRNQAKANTEDDAYHHPCQTSNMPACLQLVDMLATTESRAAFKWAVEVEDSIHISIDELCRSFPDGEALLPTIKRLVQAGRELVLKDQTLKQVALDEAAHNQELLEGRLMSMEAELKKEMSLSSFSQHIHEPKMQKLWNVYFKHEQAVRWGLWWAVFPAKLEGLHETNKKEVGPLSYIPWHSCVAHLPAGGHAWPICLLD
ncbi:hypothetical protein HaLaN_26144, partial [Haematococcus lacustris]